MASAHRAGASLQPIQMTRAMRGDNTPGRGEDAWQLGAQESQTLPHRNAALQKEGADLIDDAGALADQPFADPV
jgi:hypothetical protein